MTKINKYQKIVLLLYGIAFIYFSIINVPFKTKRGSEIVYDTLFSNRANIDFSRLSLVIIITTLISGILFLVVRNLRLTFKLKLKPRPKLKRAFYILIGVVIVAVSAFLLIQKYGNSFNFKKGANKIDSNSVIVKEAEKIQTSLPIFDTMSQINLPPFLKNRYLYDGKIFDFSQVFHAAKRSNLDVDDYIKKAGITVVDEKGLSMLPDLLKKYKTPNGKVVEGSVLLQKYGDRFYKLLGDSTFKVDNEIGQVNKVKMIFPDGTIKDIEDADTAVAKSLGGKAYQPDKKAKTIKMIFPDGSIGDIPTDAVNGALKAGAKRLH